MRQSLNLLLGLSLLVIPSAGLFADEPPKPEHHHEKKLSPAKPTPVVPHAEQKKHVGTESEKSAAKQQAAHRETAEETKRHQEDARRHEEDARRHVEDTRRHEEDARRHEIERRRLIELEMARANELARLRALGLPTTALGPGVAAPLVPALTPSQGTDAGAAPAVEGADAAGPPPGTAPAQIPLPQQSRSATQLSAASAAPAALSSNPAAPATIVAPPAAAAAASVAPSCLPEIAKAEKRYNIPEGLLVSISLVESGRRDADTGILAPWPWTIDAHGQGQYFNTIDAAAAAAGELLANNDGLVDVGCMQVDLYHHPHAFQTLLAAFDPETNVDYAARYLVELKGQSGSWASAVGTYHTGNPLTGGEYVARVLYYWKNVGATATTAHVVAEKPGVRGFLIDARPAPLEIAAGFIESKDYPAATAIYRAILVGAPDDQMAMLGLAQSMRATGHNDEARQQLERLLTENPGNRAALASLLSIIDELAPPQRMTALLSARQVVPTSAQIPARLAMVEENRGNHKEALAQMGTAVRLEPNDPILHLDYALLLDKGGYRAASIDAYTRFLQLYQPGSVALTVSLDQVKQRLTYLRTHAP